MHLEFRKGSAWASKYGRMTASKIKPDDVRKITVIRHAAIGDMIAMRPFLVEARKYFPNAFITLSIIKSFSYGVPEDLVDRVHVVDKSKRTNNLIKSKLLARIKQAKELGEQDIIFNLTDSNLSYTITLLNRAKLKVGFPYRLFKRIFCDIATLRSDYVIETESMLHQLNILGAKHAVPYNYGYKVTYKRNGQYIIYFAGASTAHKCWESNKFKDLIGRMAEDYPSYCHVILRGIKDDEQFDDIVEPLSVFDNVITKDSMPLEKTMKYLGEASLVICNDTGIRNMAIGANTPTVGIFFATGPFRYWPRYGLNDVVFNSDYTSPEVVDVYNSASSILNRMPNI